MSEPNLTISEGCPYPLGATEQADGSVNFAVVAYRADAVDLCLFWNSEAAELETARIRLHARTRGVWHISIGGLPRGCRYGYRVQGPWKPAQGSYFNHQKLLLDPYARLVAGISRYHPSMRVTTKEGKPDLTDSGKSAPKGCIAGRSDFDWQGKKHLTIPMEDTAVYEMHVRGFSMLNSEIPPKLRGTYAGLGHEASIRYLTDLGITSVQLLPVHHHLDDGFLIDRGLVNYWGYNTLAYFAPERRYAATDDPIREFREMVRALHHAGIEVILDVVYNHTCETGVDGPTCLFRGFDNTGYYRTALDNLAIYDDVTGCGNTVDTSKRDAMALVMDSLRYWVTEMGVDGFRFDLAATLGRDPRDYTPNSAIFRAIHQDPVLHRTKLIAEPWDIGRGGYHQGNFPVIWSELNGKYRDCVRRFWRGDSMVVGEFATRLTGSADLFAHNFRPPSASLNMITSHDGFTLRDLVSYHHKHNEANGEHNRDGENHNLSFNHGAEGKTNDNVINELRRRQVRNFFATLMCSQGAPFITAGDERLRTQWGNNNAYCQDNELSWMNWQDDPEQETMIRFVRKMLRFRKANPALRKTRFFTGNEITETGLADVTWLNIEGEPKNPEDWSVKQSGAFGMLIHREASRGQNEGCGFLFLLFNARPYEIELRFPARPEIDWRCLIDTIDPEGNPVETEARPGDTIKIVSRSLQIWGEKELPLG